MVEIPLNLQEDEISVERSTEELVVGHYLNRINIDIPFVGHTNRC